MYTLPAFSQFISCDSEFMNMAWNISEIMENENVLGCNLNIEQLERETFLGKKNIIHAHKYTNL